LHFAIPNLPSNKLLGYFRTVPTGRAASQSYQSTCWLARRYPASIAKLPIQLIQIAAERVGRGRKLGPRRFELTLDTG
jgi:hypothetical protein